MRMKAVTGIQVGDRFRVTRTFTEQDLLYFAAVSRDYNPVHFDDRFAAIKNFDGRICHGLLVGSLLTEIGGQLGWLATEMHFKFRKPVYIGDTVTCEVAITRTDERGYGEADVVFTNSSGMMVIEAQVKGNLPEGRDKEIMKRMLKEGDPTNPLTWECQADKEVRGDG